MSADRKSLALSWAPVALALAWAAVALALFVMLSPVFAQVPDGYKIHAVISACTSQGCQQQTWFLRSSAWCGKTADGWSPTLQTGKLSVTCRR
jgi:hypothetical protein